MPSNNRRGRSKKEQPSGDLCLKDIDDVENWKELIDMICAYLKLPDLTTRAGVKKFHANFVAIYAQITGLLTKYDGNIKVKGAVAGIFAKLSADALLRDKLFEKGALATIIPLIQIDETRHLALRALSTFTHHGGLRIRYEIAKFTHDFIKLIRDFPDDETTIELSIGTIAHSLMAVTEGEGGPRNPQVFSTIDMVNVLNTLMEAVKRPYQQPISIIQHTIELLSVVSMHASKAFKACPSAINFLAAGLRSKDWATRCICYRGLDNIFYMEAEQDKIQPDPLRFSIAVSSPVPNHLSRLMENYGIEKCELSLTKTSTISSTMAMMTYQMDHDLYALGLKQAALITQTEFSISDGMGFSMPSEASGDESILRAGGRWSDSLPLSAEAIRAKGKPGEPDLADILDIKYFLGRWRQKEAVEIARKGLERNPEQAYFYYAQSMSGNPVQALRAAKKGLKCKEMTSFIRYQLLQRAINCSAVLGVQMFQNMPQPDDQDWVEGITLLTSAFEDAKEFLDCAPPDNRYRKNVGYWYIILRILTDPDISPELNELKDDLKSLAIAFEFSEFIGLTPAKTNLRLTQETLVKHYPLGVREFGHVYSKFDKIKEVPSSYSSDAKKTKDDLATWLEDMRLEDGTMEQHLGCGTVEAVTQWRPLKYVNEQELTLLYRCSWCRNPSAALRKCAQCSKARYCDAACQKAHWRLHKKDCKSA
ncbi:hypothetical protein CPC08DRAFT_762103 [Agrocybe pediades]|nr:hypothetical protein CPC08DRAFT_762103 [Agrocybe pediades]